MASICLLVAFKFVSVDGDVVSVKIQIFFLFLLYIFNFYYFKCFDIKKN